MRPATGSATRFAVIGAGIAGLSCAQALQAAGAKVTVFEREEFPGGRAATLVGPAGTYDHGAQYFTGTDPRFADEVQRWRSAGIAQQWLGRIVAFESGAAQDKTGSAERFVGVPGMRRLGLYMAQGLDVRPSTTIARLQRASGGWHLQGEGQDAGTFGPFDAVVVAMPSALAAPLLDGVTPLVEQARAVLWDPCWTVSIALAQGTGADFEGAFINDDPILGWAALDSAKPRRGRIDGVAERWVLHARPLWSRRCADMDEREVCRWLARAFSARLRRTLSPVQAHALKWPHATPLNPLPQPFLWDAEQQVGMAGDWCGGPRIEGAYLSGLALAQALVQ